MPPSQATLVVVNEVVNDNGGTAVASDWTTTVTGGNPAPASFQARVRPGTTVTLDAGSYDVTDGPLRLHRQFLGGLLRHHRR